VLIQDFVQGQQTPLPASDSEEEADIDPVDPTIVDTTSEETISSTMSNDMKPTKPTMGDLTQLSKDEWSAWTGGKPKSDWTSIDESSPVEFTTPNQLRPVYASSAQKGYNYRKTGITNKFEKSGDLLVFQNSIWDHLVDTGMDTIAYIPDPVDDTRMINVVKNHARFTVKSASTMCASQVKKYDKYDMTNDRAARLYLLDSLSAALKNKVQDKISDSDTFPIVWLQFIKSIQSTSIERYEQLKKYIKERKATQYSGQDIEKMSKDLRDASDTLISAGQYDHNLTLSMVEAFLEAGGDNNEDFRFPLRSIKQKLDQALLDIGYKDKEAAVMHMSDLNLMPTDVCNFAEDLYQVRYEKGTWPPAKSVQDAKRPPAGYGAHVGEVGTPLTEAQILLLIQQNNTKGNSGNQGKKGNCHGCGSSDHWLRDCPHKRNQNGNRPASNGGRGGSQRGGGSQGRGGNGAGGRNQREDSQKSWRSTKPPSGTPTTKQVNGKTFNWCVKCGRWTTTHTTQEHTGKVRSEGSTPMANFSEGLIPDPAAWNVSVNVEPFNWADVWSTIWAVIRPVLMIAGFGAYTAVFYNFAAPFLRFVVEWNWALVAPLLWIVATLVSVFHQPFLDRYFPTVSEETPPDPKPTRRERRNNYQKSRRERRRRKFRPGSIIDHGLHPNYPRRLRSRGHYVLPHAPTFEEREVAHAVDILSKNVQILRSKVHALTHPRSASTGREGGETREETVFLNTPNPRQAHANHANQPQAYLRSHDPNYCRPLRRRPRARTRSPTRYQPVPATASLDPSLGNNRCTSKQVNAARRIQNHIAMAMANVSEMGVTLRMALQAPVKFRESIPVSSTFNVIWDSGASISISNDKQDFVGPLTSPGMITQLKGIAKGLRIEGQGHVIWVMHDANGYLRKVRVPAFYVPKCRVKLLSTTSLLQEYTNETIKADAHQMTLSGIPNDFERGAITARVNPSNNLPTSIAYNYHDVPIAAEALNTVINEVSAHNGNLNEQEKEILKWHHRLGHIGFRKVQFLMRTGVLSSSEAQRRLHSACCRIEKPPLCAACQYGKQKRRPTPSKESSVVRDNVGALKKEDLFPGQRVSVDHFICSTKGRLFTSAGKTKDSEMYDGGCIFVDHSSGYLYIVFQTTIDTHETLKAKQLFELHCRDYGVVPQSYQSDNGKPFTSQGFSESLSMFAQVIRFAGVGAHHHNGTAERAIQTIMSIARTMMLHAAIHWPDTADPTLWPMAVQHAVFLYNHIPNPATGIAPIDIFTRTRWEQRKFRELHVFGCPVYVLSPKIADGKKLPRWTPRSKRQMNMGLSSKHASTVPLTLDLDTGYIKTNFHVVFDDWFSTVASDISQLPDFDSDEWNKLFGESVYQYILDDEDLVDVIDLSGEPTPKLLERRESVARAFDQLSPATPLPVSPLPESPLLTTPLPSIGPIVGGLLNTDMSSPRASHQVSETRETFERREMSEPRELLPELQVEQPVSINPNQASPIGLVPSPNPQREKATTTSPPKQATSPLPVPPPKSPVAAAPKSQPIASIPRRSGRDRKPPNRLGYDGNQTHGYMSSINFDASEITFVPSAHVASNSDPDTLSYDEAMADLAHKVDWQKSAVREVLALVEKGTWEEVDIATATSRILPGTWVFRRKRNPDGDIVKFKGRYCVRGDLQEGEHDTFAPVVAWSTVRFFLVFAITYDWTTCSIDFSNAFVQSVLKDDVWIHLPRGFRSSRGPNTCLKLKKSLYGLSIAPRLWYETLSQALLDEGFKQSQNDKCLFYKPGFLIVLYVDDAGLAVKNPIDIDELLVNLRAKGFEMTRESTFAEFLGIKFTKNETTGAITLTQKGLINKIIEATGMQNCNPNWVPAAREGLGIDPEGEPMNETWSYPSIVGMLLYLSTNSRPDIAFAVSQVGRFSHAPKKTHAAAVKSIVRYLHRTKDMGTIVQPTGQLTLDCYVDADFAGLYQRDPSESPTSVKSRTGYIIMLGDVPLVWRSQLQSSISLSTQEAEYQALSNAMKTVIPLRGLIVEILEALDLPPEVTLSFQCRAFEDNNGALLLANNQRLTNRTKYYQVKWHWFWHHVNDKSVNIVKVDTLEQRADYLTKGLTREAFERIRMLVQGW